MNELKKIREQKGLTQSDLASLTGISQPHIASIESGKLLPNNSTRRKIEKILGSEVDWLKTFSADLLHVGFALQELVNLREPGAGKRIQYCRRYLNELEKII